MKQIKFRAWHKDGAYMMPVEEIDFENKLINKSGVWRWFNELVLMQYTGLKDKNGVEIFEGDYVVGVQYLTTSPNVPFEIKGVVRYSERNTMFYIDDKNKGHDMFMQSLGSTPYILEVIGNIYENPDLLEVSE